MTTTTTTTTTTAERDRLTYVAVHTQGYDSHADLILLAAPSSHAGALRRLADRICWLAGGRNGRYHTESAAWAWQMIRQHPQLFYGHIPGREVETTPRAALLSRYADRVVQDLDEGTPDAAVRAAMARNGDRQHYPEMLEELHGTR